jgi:predicted RNase H-like HicB family nuclease
MTTETTTTTTDETATFHAQFRLEDGIWLAEISEFPEVHTFGRTLGKAREYIVDALALWIDKPVEEVRGQVAFEVPDLPQPIREAAQLAVSARVLAECINKETAELTAAGASALVVDGHLSIRDAAEILGISYQRVHQILPDGSSATAAAAAIRERADWFNSYVLQQNAQPSAPKAPDADDFLKMVAFLLIGGAIGALIARS